MLYPYTNPVEAGVMFLLGIAAAVGLRWMLLGARLPRITESLKTWQTSTKNPINQLAKRIEGGQQGIKRDVGIFFVDTGVLSVFKFAVEHPELRGRLMAYLGSSVLGYLLGSLATGMQEVWVRRAETQIRADLLHRLQDNFRRSIQIKTAQDTRLRDEARTRLWQLLNQHRVMVPAELFVPGSAVPHAIPYYRFPYEPIHFSTLAKPKPVGFQAIEQGIPSLPSGMIGSGRPLGNPKRYKALLFGLGAATGLLGQVTLALMSPRKRALKPLKELSMVFNVKDIEALFMAGNSWELWSILGLTGLAKVGKSLVDGYREIEVTRQHANTELRFQAFNWLQLDPMFHQIAQQEALHQELRKFKEELMSDTTNRPRIRQRIQTILNDIDEGRYAAPRYWLMTPPVNLLPARS